MDENPPLVMTVREVAMYLHVHPSTIYRLAKSAEIPVIRVGSELRFRTADIDKWMRVRQVQ
jgi:excisionase family DNA binding protein